MSIIKANRRFSNIYVAMRETLYKGTFPTPLEALATQLTFRSQTDPPSSGHGSVYRSGIVAEPAITNIASV